MNENTLIIFSQFNFTNIEQCFFFNNPLFRFLLTSLVSYTCFFLFCIICFISSYSGLMCLSWGCLWVYVCMCFGDTVCMCVCSSVHMCERCFLLNYSLIFLFAGWLNLLPFLYLFLVHSSFSFSLRVLVLKLGKYKFFFNNNNLYIIIIVFHSLISILHFRLSTQNGSTGGKQNQSGRGVWHLSNRKLAIFYKTIIASSC